MKSATGYCACQCGQRTAIADRTSRRDGDVKGQPRLYVHGHHNRRWDIDYIEVDRGFETPCWIWQKSHTGGYGVTWVGQRDKGKMAHILYYENKFGPVGDGFEIHHRCRVKLCVNPDHLDKLPMKVHKALHQQERITASKLYFSNITHCPHGHEYTRENTYHNPKTGHRACKVCFLRRNREQRERKRALEAQQNR